QSWDLQGNPSVVVTTRVFFVVLEPLRLSLGGTGRGTVSGATNGQLLEIGRGYALTATAVAGSHFTGWSGDVSSTNPVLHFLMQTNFTVQAGFADVQNPTVTITTDR